MTNESLEGMKMKIPDEKDGDSGKKPDKISKEEMNLAEYPFTLLSAIPLKGVTRIEYSDWVTKDGKQKQLRWVVSGSEEHGLPVGGDQDIYVAIMEVWREQGFRPKFPWKSVF
jgi:hypothetical protein